MAEWKDIAATLSRLAVPGMTPKELMSAVRAVHADATKKDVTRAALYSMIQASEADPARAADLHTLAFDTRIAADIPDETAAPKPARKPRTRRTATRPAPAPSA